VRAEFGSEFGPLARVEQDACPQLHALQPQLLKPHPLSLGPPRIGQIGIGRPAPQVERLTEPDDVVGVGEAARRVQRVLEPADVHGLARQSKCVTGPLRHQHARRRTRRPIGFEGSAQRGDERAQRAEGSGRRVNGPQVVDERVSGDHPPLGRNEPGEHLAMSRPAQRDRAAVRAPRLHSPEHTDPHVPHSARRITSRRPSHVRRLI
jgi:hypothetical protein